MLIDANTASKRVALRADCWSRHVHDISQVPSHNPLGKPLVISNDGAILDPDFPVKIGGKNGLGWGMTPADLHQLAAVCMQRGYSVEDWSHWAWATSWGMRSRVGNNLNQAVSALSPLDNAPAGTKMRLVRMADVLQELHYDERWGKRRALEPEGKLGTRGRSFTWNGRDIPLWFFSIPSLLADPSLPIDWVIGEGRPGSEGHENGFLRHLGIRGIRVFCHDQFVGCGLPGDVRERWGLSLYYPTLGQRPFLDRVTELASKTFRSGMVLCLSLPPERFQAEFKEPSDPLHVVSSTALAFPWGRVLDPAWKQGYLADLYDVGHPNAGVFLESIWDIVEAVLQADGAGANVIYQVANEPDFYPAPKEQIAEWHDHVAGMIRSLHRDDSSVSVPVPDAPKPPAGPGTDTVPSEVTEALLDRLRANARAMTRAEAKRDDEKLLDRARAVRSIMKEIDG